MVGPTRAALDVLSQWEYSLPFTSQWIVKIDPVNTATSNTLLSNIGVGTIYDKAKWSLDSQVQQILFANMVNNDTLGTYFARKVDIPGESFQVQDTQNADMFGYIQGTVGGNRSTITSKQLDIGFISTNLDFVEGIIRPWIITAGYSGLLAQPPNRSIKCNISIVQYTRGLAASNARPISMIYQFFDCVPISILANSLSYGDEHEVIKSVSWTFINYTTKIFDFQNQEI